MNEIYDLSPKPVNMTVAKSAYKHLASIKLLNKEDNALFLRFFDWYAFNSKFPKWAKVEVYYLVALSIELRKNTAPQNNP